MQLARQFLLCRQDSDPPHLPRGMTLCFSLIGTHGDPFYIGLNGFEIYSQTGDLVAIDSSQVVAVPSSINDLKEVHDGGGGDCRIPDNLVDGVNDTWDPQHIWLAPYSRVGLQIQNPYTC